MSQTQREICNKCQRIFYRKLVSNRPKGGLIPTKINEVSYWTNGKTWNNCKILCRGCLNDWFDKHHGAFSSIVDKEKRKLFHHYRYIGILSKEKELYE